MAIINYNDTFDRIRALIWLFDLLDERQRNTATARLPIAYLLNQTATPFKNQDKLYEFEDLLGSFSSLSDQYTSLKADILSALDEVLVTIGQELSVPTPTDTAAVLEALVAAMTKDSQTVHSRTIEVHPSDIESAAEIKVKGTNTGNGILIHSFADGYGDVAEISFEEVMRCACTSATSAGAETFTLSGAEGVGRTEPQAPGSGLSTTMSVALEGGLLSNSDLENWTGTLQEGDAGLIASITAVGSPTKLKTKAYHGLTDGQRIVISGATASPWTALDGTWTITFVDEDEFTIALNSTGWDPDDYVADSGAIYLEVLDDWIGYRTDTDTEAEWGNSHRREETIVNHGDNALCLDITPGCILVQAFTASERSVYTCGFWARKSVGASGTLTVSLVDEDLVAVSATTLVLDISTLADDAWSFHYFVFETPALIAVEWNLQLKITSAGAGRIYLDEIQLAEMTEWNHIHFAVFAGSTDFAIDDEFGFGSDARGFTIRVVPWSDAMATESDSTQTNIRLDGDQTAYFPVGSWVQHPTDLTWHRVISSTTGGGKTTVVVTPKAFTSWVSLNVYAIKQGKIQEFFARCFEVGLPSAGSPTQGDP